MAPKKTKPAKSKDVGGRGKSFGSKGRIKKKRKHAPKKVVHTNFSYTLLPRRKRLAKKVVAKLNNENDHYMIARGLDAIKRLDHGKTLEEVNEKPIKEEVTWREAKKAAPDHKKWKDNKVANIVNREVKRRRKAEAKREQELHRKIYRLHPHDGLHYYIRGYKKTRHRITKKRFMSCVDVPLFQTILEESKDLLESPLWTEKFHIKTLSVEKAKQLKDHLRQFDVIVEALKQGIFDKEGCDDFPIHKVRRIKKKKKPSDVPSEPIKKKKREARSNSSSERKRLKRKFSFPPYEESNDELDAKDPNAKMGVLKGAINLVTSWITAKKSTGNVSRLMKVSHNAPKQKQQRDVPSKRKSPAPSVSGSTKNRKSQSSVLSRESLVPQPFKWARKTTLISFPPPKRQSMARMSSEDSETYIQKRASHTPYGDLLTINVPDEPGPQRKFIRTLVERKAKKKVKRNNTKSAAVQNAKHEEDEARQRHERAEKSDPLQRLHQDDKDSDIWTLASTTTTDGYASWRRPRDLRNVGNKQEVLAHKVDTTFGLRVVLLLIVLWEIGCFVKERLDDVYYWIFASHLYRENIWLFEPTLFPPMEKYFAIHLQEWVHVIISGISLSIIHRENECVSLLFAFSMLCDGLMEVGISTHDYVYLPEPVDWLVILLTALHIIWKVFIICLFIGYHYYCSGYIRKAREFRHRKIKLHNHEIKAKGTKGLQKRRMAWRWMTRHARNTNLKCLKRKYPNVKDGNFPEDELAKEIKFNESKELRIYTLNHSLNIGYPYNKLDDMRRYVFKRLEKSDYTDNDVMEETVTMQKKMSKLARRSSKAITVGRWQAWRKVRDEKDQTIVDNRLPSIVSISSHFRGKDEAVVPKSTPARGTGLHSTLQIREADKRASLTIGPSYSHREFEKQKRLDLG